MKLTVFHDRLNPRLLYYTYTRLWTINWSRPHIYSYGSSVLFLRTWLTKQLSVNQITITEGTNCKHLNELSQLTNQACGHNVRTHAG